MGELLRKISFIVLVVFSTTVVLGGSGWGGEISQSEVGTTSGKNTDQAVPYSEKGLTKIQLQTSIQPSTNEAVQKAVAGRQIKITHGPFLKLSLASSLLSSIRNVGWLGLGIGYRYGWPSYLDFSAAIEYVNLSDITANSSTHGSGILITLGIISFHELGLFCDTQS